MKTASTAVRPVCGQQLLITRAERRLLSVTEVTLGESGCTAIVGPNGAGKSLLVRTLCALQRADSGIVTWGGRPPDSLRRHRVGLILQRPVLLRRSALDNIIYSLKLTGISGRKAAETAHAAMEVAGLGALANVPARLLSGGEQQRLALVRALVLNPDMLFLDEATANVDPASTLAIEHQLVRAVQAGLSVVLVSHDIGQVKRLADDVVLMHNGDIIEQSSTVDFFEHTQNPVSQRWIAGELLI